MKLELNKISTTEKFIMLEDLWNDLSKQVHDKRLTPKWHLDTLSERESSIKNGNSNFNNFSETKKRLHAIVEKY